MPDKDLDTNPVTVAIREFFGPLVQQTRKLPAPLAYGLASVLAILVIVLLGAAIPRDVVLLVGMIILATLGVFVFADWDSRRLPPPSPVITDPHPPVTTLGVPTSGKLGLLVDLSHQQNKWNQWRPKSIFDLPLKESNLISLIIPPSDNVLWDIQEISQFSQFVVSDLLNWRGLIFAIPFQKQISQEVCNTIAEWVSQGGRLILLGYELGERHHQTNLSILSDRLFGLRFNSDIVAPENWGKPSEKAYNHEIVFNNIDSSKHSILKGVQKLSMRNVCTLTVEPGSNAILTVGNNRISRAVNPHYTDGYTSSGSYQFELVPQVEGFPVIAEAPQGLCGKGKVIAIGTWDFFGPDDCFKNSDNYTFVRNLLTWSLER